MKFTQVLTVAFQTTCFMFFVAGTSVLLYQANKETGKYETLCLIESEKLVTYRGVTSRPKRQPDYWEVLEQDTVKPRRVIGDCFFHPIQ